MTKEIQQEFEEIIEKQENQILVLKKEIELLRRPRTCYCENCAILSSKLVQLVEDVQRAINKVNVNF